MKNIRISPLNILTAGILCWLGFALFDKALLLSTAIWAIVLIIVVIVVDQFFRMMLKNLTRIWLVQMIFLLLVLLVVWLLRGNY